MISGLISQLAHRKGFRVAIKEKLNTPQRRRERRGRPSLCLFSSVHSKS